MGFTLIVTFVIKRAESWLGGSCRDNGRDPGGLGSRQAKGKKENDGDWDVMFFHTCCLFPFTHIRQLERCHRQKKEKGRSAVQTVSQEKRHEQVSFAAS